MSVAVTIRHTRKVPGVGVMVVADVVGDASQASGGETLAPATLGLNRYFSVHTNGWYATAANATGYASGFDHANQKILAFEGNYDAADGPLQETTANLTGFNCRVVAFGR